MIKQKVRVIVSHPIQYHAVIWRELAKLEGIDFEVYFCSNHGQSKTLDREFGVAFKWDIPLKDGYKSRTFKNLGFGVGFFKCLNIGLLFQLMYSKIDIIYFHGVNHFTAYFAFWLAKLKGSKTIIRNIAHLKGEKLGSTLRIKLRDLIYGSAYRNSSYCLYIGELNKRFFQSFKVNESKLIHAPHVVDNDFFQKNKLTNEAAVIYKKKLGIAHDSLVMLFCGKLIQIKQPFMLLRAFAKAKLTRKVTLVFVGDGELRAELEEESKSITRMNTNKYIKFIGFQNQSELPKNYSIADFLVLPSKRETWGLVVNEVMNYSSAVIVSDHVGASKELVSNNSGIVFKRDSIEELTKAIEVLVNNDDKRQKYQRNAFRVIKNWSVSEFSDAMVDILEKK